MVLTLHLEETPSGHLEDSRTTFHLEESGTIHLEESGNVSLMYRPYGTSEKCTHYISKHLRSCLRPLTLTSQ
jgi:hypothetical protein